MKGGSGGFLRKTLSGHFPEGLRKQRKHVQKRSEAIWQRMMCTAVYGSAHARCGCATHAPSPNTACVLAVRAFRLFRG